MCSKTQTPIYGNAVNRTCGTRDYRAFKFRFGGYPKLSRVCEIDWVSWTGPLKCAVIRQRSVSDRLNTPRNERRTMENPELKCPECKSPLQPVKMIDATSKMGDAEGRQHVELSYAAPDAAPGLFSGKISRLGTVRGYICPSRGRISLYGRAAT